MLNLKQKLRKEADKLWQKKILLRTSSCEVCNDYPYVVQAHHFYYKSNYGHLRYDLDNGIRLCKKCHFVLHHQDPKKIEEKIIEKRGEKWHKELQEKSREKLRLSYQTTSWYNEQIKRLS
ncbi:MAG TPA: HNH endonuclease [Candidatus Scalindua sp.]|nr:HNH endonuclease [Candidatus Scalindua sp.]